MKIQIIENTCEAKNKHGHAYGSEPVPLTKVQLDALKRGKCLAVSDGEYVAFIYLDAECLASNNPSSATARKRREYE